MSSLGVLTSLLAEPYGWETKTLAAEGVIIQRTVPVPSLQL